MERESSARAVKAATAELQYMARMAGLIQEDERIVYIPGSRSHAQPPEVDVRGPRGPRPLDLMPDFTHLTREREVAVAMQAAAATLRVLTAEGKLTA